MRIRSVSNAHITEVLLGMNVSGRFSVPSLKDMKGHSFKRKVRLIKRSWKKLGKNSPLRKIRLNPFLF